MRMSVGLCGGLSHDNLAWVAGLNQCGCTGYEWVCVCMGVCVCMRVYLGVRVYIWVRVRVYIWVRVRVYGRVHMYGRVYARVYVRVYVGALDARARGVG